MKERRIVFRGDRYGYWGCGANVFYEMTKNEHPGFELPVSLPGGQEGLTPVNMSLTQDRK